MLRYQTLLLVIAIIFSGCTQDGEGSGSQFDDSILDGDPSRGPGYEVFLSGATV